MNRLATETSPYLRQHRDNPVDWYPWGDQAFRAAAERDVPILLSVGYSACHWCHVMAHESFEDDQVAAAMNATFVNVKVDREERPDVDAIYMDAVQAMTQRGGWPMTVFLTPKGEPFYGGTYFPKPNFLQLIAAVREAWANRRGELVKNVGPLRETITHSTRLKAGADLPPEAMIPATVAGLARGFDPAWGGFGSAPKFPSTMSLDLILAEIVHRGPDDPESSELTNIVATSLDAMASGGMYDHIGGGFARYSVDERWLVPHFEKMLYDQALLVRVYSHAATLFSSSQERWEPRWRQVVEEIVAYVLREMTQSDGGFSSAQDADSPGPDGHNHEGLFHTWTPTEVRAVLGDEPAAAVCDYYDITEPGNFADEGTRRSIPNRIAHRGDWDRPPELEAARQALFEARSMRPPPALDDKVLTEWNALMISSLADAGALFGRQDWIDAAARAARFLIAELRDDRGRWRRAWHAAGEPKANHAALAADHAALVDAFTRLAEATGQASWITEAIATADTMLDHFWDPGEGGLFTTPDDGERLIARQKDLFDNATPSANSTAAVALYRLAALTGEARYANHADRILRLIGPVISRGASAFTNALMRTRPAQPRHQGSGGRRRSSRPAGRRAGAVAPERRARVGRALRITTLGVPARRPRIRLRALRLPGPAGHPRGFAPAADLTPTGSWLPTPGCQLERVEAERRRHRASDENVAVHAAGDGLGALPRAGGDDELGPVPCREIVAEHRAARRPVERHRQHHPVAEVVVPDLARSDDPMPAGALARPQQEPNRRAGVVTPRLPVPPALGMLDQAEPLDDLVGGHSANSASKNAGWATGVRSNNGATPRVRVRPRSVWTPSTGLSHRAHCLV